MKKKGRDEGEVKGREEARKWRRNGIIGINERIGRNEGNGKKQRKETKGTEETKEIERNRKKETREKENRKYLKEISTEPSPNSDSGIRPR
jgi:hypothetical protein